MRIKPATYLLAVATLSLVTIGAAGCRRSSTEPDRANTAAKFCAAPSTLHVRAFVPPSALVMLGGRIPR